MVISCMPEHRLSEAERAVVDYINKQQCIISLLSMEDIASGAFVSNATVSRAIRKCDFSSFSEMKYRLAEDAKNDRTSEQMNRVLSMSYTECIETVKRIDIPTVLDELCDLALYGYSQPIYPNRFFGGTSRIGLMIMTRTIVEYMESETAAYAEENEK